MKRYATSLAELAAIFEKSVITLQKYGHQGCPCRVADKDDRGRLRVAPIRKWLKDHGYLGKRPPNAAGRPARNGTSPSDTALLRAAQAKERQHKANLAELEEKRKRGELVSVEAVRELNKQTMAFLIDSLESWARSLGPALAGKTALEINREMTARVERLLREFAERRNA